jgi:hypothetical protein
MSNRINHQEIVKKIISAKTVDFGAIGKSFAELGPSLALADDPWEVFCGTMRIFIRIYIIHGPIFNVEELRGLSGAAAELKT